MAEYCIHGHLVRGVVIQASSPEVLRRRGDKTSWLALGKSLINVYARLGHLLLPYTSMASSGAVRLEKKVM